MSFLDDISNFFRKRKKLDELKENAADYQTYRQEIKQERGVDIVGKKFEKIDMEKRLILDNISKDNEPFNAMTLVFVDSENKLSFMTVRLNKDVKQVRFPQIYEQINVNELEEMLQKYVKENNSPPNLNADKGVELLAIRLTDVTPANVTGEFNPNIRK